MFDLQSEEQVTIEQESLRNKEEDMEDDHDGQQKGYSF
jgi:hypothetical protein